MAGIFEGRARADVGAGRGEQRGGLTVALVESGTQRIEKAVYCAERMSMRCAEIWSIQSSGANWIAADLEDIPEFICLVS